MNAKKLISFLPAIALLVGCGDTPTPEPENILQSIEINSNNAKTEYEEGDRIVPDGLIIICNWTRGVINVQYEECPNEFTFSPSLTAPLTVDDTTVTVTFKEKTASYAITVEAAPQAESFSIDFSSVNLGGEKQIFGDEDRFKTNIMAIANSDLLTDISTSKDNTVKIEESEFTSGFEDVQGLIIASSKKDGDITFTFSKKLHKVSIKAQQYYNVFVDYYEGQPYDSCHYDGQRFVDLGEESYFEGYFELDVNGQKFEGPGETYEYDEEWNLIVTVPEIVEEEFTIDSTSLTISAEASVRSRIYEMTFTFEE